MLHIVSALSLNTVLLLTCGREARKGLARSAFLIWQIRALSLLFFTRHTPDAPGSIPKRSSLQEETEDFILKTRGTHIGIDVSIYRIYCLSYDLFFLPSSSLSMADLDIQTAPLLIAQLARADVCRRHGSPHDAIWRLD